MATFPIAGSHEWALPLKQYIDEIAAEGEPGKSVELRKTATHLQWRQDGGLWFDLVPLTEIKGAPGIDGDDGTNGTNGASVQLQKSTTHIQWRLVGASTWTNLVALSEIKGDPGTSASIPADTLRLVQHDGNAWPALTGPGTGFYVSADPGAGSPPATGFGIWIRKKG